MKEIVLCSMTSRVTCHFQDLYIERALRALRAKRDQFTSSIITEGESIALSRAAYRIQ